MDTPRKWLLALRPWSFSMSVISVSMGTLWAAGSDGIGWTLYGLTLLAMVFFHAAANLFNDYSDVKNRVDVPGAPTARYRPHPLVHHELSLNQVLAASLCLLAAGTAISLYLAAARGWPIVGIGVAGVAVGIAYTARPVALKQHALGEVAVFLVWGPLAVQAAYFIQAQTLSLPLLWVSVPFGLLVALTMLANNLRDHSYDSQRDIRTISVLLGRKRTRWLYSFLIVCAFLAVAIMAFTGPLTAWSLIVLLAVPTAVRMGRMIHREIPDDADARTARLVISFGVLMLIGLIIEGLLS